MVHEKYIKRGNKVFGPYLYKNYRENGKTKTKYLGKTKKKSIKNLLTRKFFIIFGIILLILILIFLFGNKIFDIESLKGKLASEKFLSVFVNITGNDPPEILNVSEEILVCENRWLDYPFNVSDAEGVKDLDVRLEPINPFYLREPFDRYDFHISTAIISDVADPLNKQDVIRKRANNYGWAVYPETITADDGIDQDFEYPKIIIIEVNNPPIFDVGVQTLDLYLKGEQSSFYFDIGSFLDANLEETPKEDLIFNLIFLRGERIFNLSNYGVINVTGNESFIEAGENSTIYRINITISDDGIIARRTALHQNISLCWSLLHPTWGYPLNEDPKNWSDDFYLTITKENRPPNITSHYPINLSLDVQGTDILYFNITAYDPDWTPLDVYWYVDDVSKKYFGALGINNMSEFEHNFGCGVSGNHTVKVEVTDGLLNDSVQWNLSVGYVSCPKPSPGGPGGGGPGGLYCEEKWGCEDWNQCENLEQGFKFGKINTEQRLLIEERCELFNYAEDVCGFQIRKCTDFNYCGTNFYKPGIIRECYYTEHPNCTDGIPNCHDGSCEILVDCGGPCDPCPTCNDGIQNQGEEGIDCGGPCDPCKEFPLKPKLIKMIITFSLLFLLILVLVLAIRQLMKYKKFKKEVKKGKGFEKQKYIGGFIFLIFAVILLFFANIFITNVAQKDRIVIEVDEDGILGSQALTNIYVNTMRNLTKLFRTEIILMSVIILDDTKLSIWDDTDILTIKSGLDVYFYANYINDTNGNPFSTGNCSIKFQNFDYGHSSPVPMTYNTTSLLFEYNRSFNYKGTYNFEVNCSIDSLSINGSEEFTITNSRPDFNIDEVNIFGQEDDILIYNFTSNVTEPDVNDVLTFSIESINLQPFSDYLWISLNSSTGILIINSTIDEEADLFRIAVTVLDDEDVGVTDDFYFYISPVNDPPIFINLTNQTFNSGDLSEYIIHVWDEENNIPFVFNISFITCNVPSARGNCTLFPQYSVDGTAGWINISFIPTQNDIGDYIINFSVMDNSSLGNQTTSVLVNFTVTLPIWNTSALNLNHNLIEDEEFYLNLTEMILNIYQTTVSFSNGTTFPSFNLTSNGIINFTPIDVDVGYNLVAIIASNTEGSSSRIFNFTVLNINDNLSIQPLQANNVIDLDGGFNITAYENADIEIYLSVNDDDFLIPSNQKGFYDENLTINLTLQGPNSTLFEFDFLIISENIVRYVAAFKPMNVDDVDYYNVIVNVTDKSNFSDILKFNLTILNRDYDTPNITYPDEDYEFNLKENVTFDLIFRANHTVGDNLSYEFYINDILRDSVSGLGDDSNFTWQFTPNFTDETYNETRNLTLIVSNPFFPDLNTSRTWNLTINHTNAPVEFIRDIRDKEKIFLNYALEIDLKIHFSDIDHYDNYYNQSVKFDIVSNGSVIRVSDISSDWIFAVSSSVPVIEMFNITAHDINNETGEYITNITSNNFIIEFVPPITVPVPRPVPTTSRKTIISLKIIMPGQISAYEGEKIEIPLFLVNGKGTTFNDLNLSSIAFKDGNISNEVRTALDKNYFKTLKPNQKENLTLTVFFDTDKIGDYEILVNVTSKRPRYTDWGKIHIELQRINESMVREIVLFSEELIVQNPACIEIKEIIDESKIYLEEGDFTNAKLKAEQAITACEESISQVALPKKRAQIYGINLYLILAVLLAFVIGIVYYFLKRRKFQEMKIS